MAEGRLMQYRQLKKALASMDKRLTSRLKLCKPSGYPVNTLRVGPRSADPRRFLSIEELAASIAEIKQGIAITQEEIRAIDDTVELLGRDPETAREYFLIKNMYTADVPMNIGAVAGYLGITIRHAYRIQEKALTIFGKRLAHERVDARLPSS